MLAKLSNRFVVTIYKPRTSEGANTHLALTTTRPRLIKDLTFRVVKGRVILHSCSYDAQNGSRYGVVLKNYDHGNINEKASFVYLEKRRQTYAKRGKFECHE